MSAVQAARAIVTLTRQLDRIVSATADRIAGDDCLEALRTEADLFRLLARHCAERIAMCRELGLYVAA
jgi:lysozyme family protein